MDLKDVILLFYLSLVSQRHRLFLRDVWSKCRCFIENYNLFASSTAINPDDLQNQRISTRAFLFLLALSTTILIIYDGTMLVTKVDKIDSPTYAEYRRFHEIYTETLSCPCSQISIEYRQFLRINYTIHQVCRSVFVDDRWINYLQASIAEHNSLMQDFRQSGMISFQALQMFCRMTEKTARDSLDRFTLLKFVHDKVIAEKLLQSQIKEIFTQFLSSTINNLLLYIQTTRDMMQSNGIWSARSSNFGLYFFPSTYSQSIGTAIYNYCRCDAISSCKINFYLENNNSSIYEIPEFYIGCFLSEALLQSTLECFYNQSCISTIQSNLYTNNSIFFPTLNVSEPSRFTINSTISELVQELMVEQWNLTIHHQDYFNQCQPDRCSYSYISHYSIIYIATNAFSLIGGLATILKLLVPITVKYGRKTYRLRNLTRDDLHQLSICRWFRQLHDRILNYNIFPTNPPSVDPNELRQQRQATRLYFLLLFIFIIILRGYILSEQVTKTGLVKSPTLEQYLLLEENYPQSLSCSCSKISIDYRTFVDIQYEFHSVCHSLFIRSEWIDYLITASRGLFQFSEDFRWTSRFTFQGLRAFCELSNKTIVTNLNVFFANQYVTKTPTSETIFQLQTQAMFDHFISSTASKFLSSLETILELFQANGLMSAIGTQYNIIKTVDGPACFIAVRWYGNCKCQSSAKCIYPSSILGMTRDTIVLTISGMYFGCSVIEALLQSSLECFYDSICLQSYLSYLLNSSTLIITPLNKTTLKKYQVNSVLQTLVENLMIESWTTSANYEKYFLACLPSQCVYFYTDKNDFIVILMRFISLVGGFVTVLKLLAPLLIKYTVRLIRNRQQDHRRVGTNGNMSNHNRLKDCLTNIQKCMFEFLKKLNFFSSIPENNDPKVLRNQRIATRIFLILLFVLIFVLIFYTAVDTTETTVTISIRSIENYSQLYSVHSETLSCPCSKVSISYEKFLLIQYDTHELCRSIFIRREYREMVLLRNVNSFFFSLDFEVLAEFYFQALETFCRMTNRTIENAIHQLYARQFISMFVVSQQLFLSQIETISEQLISSTTNDLMTTLRITQNISFTNALMSGRLTNYDLDSVIMTLSRTRVEIVTPVSRIYDGCDCASTPRCKTQAKIHFNSSETNTFEIPGLFIGCYITEALLQSTLECFYNATCLNLLHYYLHKGNVSIDIEPLNTSLLYRFSTQSTIEQLMNGLIIERWNYFGSFEKYYDECHPSECFYTETMRHGIVYIISMLFGIVGGLTSILKCIISIGLKLSLFLSCRHQRQKVPVIKKLNLTSY